MAIPTIAQARAYLKVSATAITDEEFTRIYNAEVSNQTLVCTVPVDYPDDLGQTLLRRIQRQVAAKNLPLGLVGLDAAEYAPSRIPALDALVEAGERPYRTQVVA